MPSIAQLITALEELAPLAYQESYDNAGLLLGDPSAPVTGVLTSLDITLPVLQEAVKNNCNFIVSHHPLLFTPLKKFQDTPTHHCLTYAIRHHLTLYTAHTNLDSVPQGVNQALGQKIGLRDLKFLQDLPPLQNTPPGKKLPPRGWGMIGVLPTPLAVPHFIAHLKKQLRLTCLRATSTTQPTIQKVAIAGGVGISLLPYAHAAQADAFVTSDIKYHQFFDAPPHMLLLDIGHYESEIPVKPWLAEYLSKKFSKIAVLESQIVTNPISYHV